MVILLLVYLHHLSGSTVPEVVQLPDILVARASVIYRPLDLATPEMRKTA